MVNHAAASKSYEHGRDIKESIYLGSESVKKRTCYAKCLQLKENGKNL